jgi:histidinol phosphatase-like enzyme (inositol monophosphatase family)
LQRYVAEMTDVTALTAFLDVLADAAAKAIMPHFRAPLSVENKRKDSFDPVTAADRAGEAAMRALINQTYPDHGIHGEEYGSERADAEYVWVLDPIDGTRSFITGVPMWGILIGLNRNGQPLLGMMYQPFSGERFAGDGKRAWYRQGTGAPRPLRTRACPSLGDASIFTTSPGLFKSGEKSAYDRLETKVRLARYGCDCYAFCMVAMGHADAALETSLQPYDIVALIPIVRGAGGQVTDWQGKADTVARGGTALATGDARIHTEAIRALAGK